MLTRSILFERQSIGLSFKTKRKNDRITLKLYFAKVRVVLLRCSSVQSNPETLHPVKSTILQTKSVPFFVNEFETTPLAYPFQEIHLGPTIRYQVFPKWTIM